jgi:hypothetical protein
MSLVFDLRIELNKEFLIDFLNSNIYKDTNKDLSIFGNFKLTNEEIIQVCTDCVDYLSGKHIFYDHLSHGSDRSTSPGFSTFYYLETYRFSCLLLTLLDSMEQKELNKLKFNRDFWKFFKFIDPVYKWKPRLLNEIVDLSSFTSKEEFLSYLDNFKLQYHRDSTKRGFYHTLYDIINTFSFENFDFSCKKCVSDFLVNLGFDFELDFEDLSFFRYAYIDHLMLRYRNKGRRGSYKGQSHYLYCMGNSEHKIEEILKSSNVDAFLSFLLKDSSYYMLDYIFVRLCRNHIWPLGIEDRKVLYKTFSKTLGNERLLREIIESSLYLDMDFLETFKYNFVDLIKNDVKLLDRLKNRSNKAKKAVEMITFFADLASF